MTESFPTVNRLHTDVLEDAYGPIHPEVIRHDDQIREAFLVDEKGIARTYALSFFSDEPVSGEIEDIAQEIQKGGSIGKTFREHGYEIRKNVVSVSVITIPGWLRDKFDVKESLAKARFSEFYARKGDEDPVIYATVLEVYTPDFRPPEITGTDMSQVNPVTSALEKEDITKIDVWNRITKGNDWSELKEQYSQAKNEGTSDIRALEEKAKEYMSHGA